MKIKKFVCDNLDVELAEVEKFINLVKVVTIHNFYDMYSYITVVYYEEKETVKHTTSSVVSKKKTSNPTTRSVKKSGKC